MSTTTHPEPAPAKPDAASSEGGEEEDGPGNDPRAVGRATVSPVGKGIEKKGTLNEKGPKKKKKKKRGKF